MSNETTAPALPPLPEPQPRPGPDRLCGYSAAQMTAYAAAAVAQDRERCASLCRRLRSLDGDFLARAIENESAVTWPVRG